MDYLIPGLQLVLQPQTLVAVLVASLFGFIVGALPGLTATMAVALLVPITFLLSPLAAIASIVSASAMAIFAGDIPGALLRIPGTPASAAYVEESYKLTLAGRGGYVLGVNATCSMIGGVIGTGVLILAAPLLADVALSFSAFEFFWLEFPRSELRRLCRRRRPAEGWNRDACWPADFHCRHGILERLPAFHLRQFQPSRGSLLHTGIDRHVRAAGDSSFAAEGRYSNLGVGGQGHRRLEGGVQFDIPLSAGRSAEQRARHRHRDTARRRRRHRLLDIFCACQATVQGAEEMGNRPYRLPRY